MDEDTITIKGKETPWAVIIFLTTYIGFSIYVYKTIIFA